MVNSEDVVIEKAIMDIYFHGTDDEYASIFVPDWHTKGELLEHIFESKSEAWDWLEANSTKYVIKLNVYREVA